MDWLGAGMTLVTNAIGHQYSKELTKLNNDLAAKREATARAENYKYGELQAGAADARTRALYEDYASPQALLRQYKEAGLSPSMMYGKGGGAGGASIPSGAMGPSAAVQPTTFGMSPVETAQIGLLNAEARKANAEADQVQPQAEATITEKLSQAGYNNAAKNLTSAQTRLEDIKADIANETKPLTIERFAKECEIIEHDARKACAEANIAEAKDEITQETMQDAITRYKEENKNIIADTMLKYAQKSLSEQQIKESETRIWNMIEQLNIEWVNALANERSTEAQAEWLEAKIPYINKELELEAERLGVEKTRVWVDGSTRMVQGICDMIMLGSSFKQGGMRTTNPKEVLKQKKNYKSGKYKEVPIYKTNVTYPY